jgi:hypothetical protein
MRQSAVAPLRAPDSQRRRGFYTLKSLELPDNLVGAIERALRI